jgi:hypothetical protein
LPSIISRFSASVGHSAILPSRASGRRGKPGPENRGLGTNDRVARQMRNPKAAFTSASARFQPRDPARRGWDERPHRCRR